MSPLRILRDLAALVILNGGRSGPVAWVDRDTALLRGPVQRNCYSLQLMWVYRLLPRWPVGPELLRHYSSQVVF